MLLEELRIYGRGKKEMIVVNKSFIHLEKHQINHGISEYTEMRHCFLRDIVNKDRLELDFCRAKMQLDDILTKPLKKTRLEELNKLIGMKRLSNKN